jgi:hypothetical protein
MEKPLLRRCIFVQTKRMGMLHGTSWKEFFTVMGLALLIYYGLLLLRYFPGWIGSNAGAGGMGRAIKGRAADALRARDAARRMVATEDPGVQAADQRGEAMDELVMGDQAGDDGAQATGQQVAGSHLALPLPEVKRAALPELANHLSREILALVEQAAMEKKERGEIIYALQLLLDKEIYRPVKASLFREKISQGIGSMVERYCSIRLDAEEVRGLWVR